MVTGGIGNANSISQTEQYLSSTEIHIMGSFHWQKVGDLPSPRYGLRGASIGNTVIVVGNILNMNINFQASGLMD